MVFAAETGMTEPQMSHRLNIAGRDVTITGRLVKLARLTEEWYEDIGNPDEFLHHLVGTKADLFTFWQRLPDQIPRYSYFMERDEVAALPVVSYEEWWSNQIKSRTRGIIRKAMKSGVEVREEQYTDEFVAGMVEIFNEAPLRQGRPFWHYGKDFATVKREFSRYLYRERLIGAHYEGQLIGFMMLGFADRYAVTGQIISKISHRDKATNNLLIAKAVEICAAAGVKHLVYVRWHSGSLSEFKRRNGFEPVGLPRYYVPLTQVGRLALATGCHEGVANVLPRPALERLRNFRSSAYRRLYALRYRGATVADSEA
jgi:hypothetical protein